MTYVTSCDVDMLGDHAVRKEFIASFVLQVMSSKQTSDTMGLSQTTASSA